MTEFRPGATAFNQNLCAWKDKFPYGYESSIEIFDNSGCTFTERPQLGNNFGGPFCASDCSPTMLPSLAPTPKATPEPATPSPTVESTSQTHSDPGSTPAPTTKKAAAAQESFSALYGGVTSAACIRSSSITAIALGSAIIFASTRFF